MYGTEESKKITCFYQKCSWVIVRENVTVKTYGWRYKQCGVNPHFCAKSIKKLRKDKYWEKLLKGSWEKINTEKINWDKLFDRSANHKSAIYPDLLNLST